jgi:hypothetical protein
MATAQFGNSNAAEIICMKTKIIITSNDLDKGCAIKIWNGDNHYVLVFARGRRDKISRNWYAQSELDNLTPMDRIWIASPTSHWTTAVKNTLRLFFSTWESDVDATG